MSAWTVLLARPDYIADDNLDTYMTHVEAKDAAQAVRRAQGEAIRMDYDGPGQLREFAECHDRDDYAPLLVIEGRHMDVKP